jgi:hypothetical protein
MKTKLNLTKIALVVLALFGSLHNASAYYDPGVQRWLNRDPISEKGHAILRNNQLYLARSHYDFVFVENTGPNKIDAEGLTPVEGCIGGGFLGGLGGAIGGIGGALRTGCWRPVFCGAAGGAVAGCVQGAACTTPIPGLCVGGGCLGGALGSVVEQACNGSLNYKNPCTWIATFLNTAVGCLGGMAETSESSKAKLVQFVVGIDVSAIGSVCE